MIKVESSFSNFFFPYPAILPNTAGLKFQNINQIIILIFLKCTNHSLSTEGCILVSFALIWLRTAVQKFICCYICHVVSNMCPSAHFSNLKCIFLNLFLNQENSTYSSKSHSSYCNSQKTSSLISTIRFHGPNIWVLRFSWTCMCVLVSSYV